MEANSRLRQVGRAHQVAVALAGGTLTLVDGSGSRHSRNTIRGPRRVSPAAARRRQLAQPRFQEEYGPTWQGVRATAHGPMRRAFTRIPEAEIEEIDPANPKTCGRGSGPDGRQLTCADVDLAGFGLGGSCGLFRPDFSVNVVGRSFLTSHGQKAIDGDAE
jgi:hypothetical protein